jgi:hypothetical protein
MVCWGFGTVMAKRSLQEAAPLTLNAMMLVASVALLWALVTLQRVRKALGSGMVPIALFGLLSPGINLTFGVFGLNLRFVMRLDPLLLVAVQQTVGLGWALTVMLVEWG